VRVLTTQYQKLKLREEFFERQLPIRHMRYLRKKFDTLILAYSGGTDSTLLLLLTKEYDISLDYVVFNNTGIEYPETVKYVHEVIEKLEYKDKFREIRPKVSVKETIQMILEDFEKLYSACRHNKNEYRCCYYVKKMPLIYFLRENHLDKWSTCIMRGMRANESSLRLRHALELVESGQFYFHKLKHSRYTKVADPIRFLSETTKNEYLQGLCKKYNIPLPETSGCSICPIFYKFANEEEKKTRRYQICARFFESKARNLITSYVC